MTAAGGLVGQNSGSFDLGSANVTLAAPIYLADTSSETSLTTTGTLNLNSNQGTALALNPVGGAISFIAGTLNDNGATIEAPAGNVSLEATTGDLTLVSGFPRQFARRRKNSSSTSPNLRPPAPLRSPPTRDRSISRQVRP